MSRPIDRLVDDAVRCGRCGKSRSECGCDVRPFSNGTEGYDWLEANCERCTKKGEYDPATGEGPCPMETAVSRGFLIGTIPAALAVEYGATLKAQRGFCSMPRQCSQFAPVMVCESIKTRNRRPCGKPATATVEASGLTRPVCERHRKAYIASLTHPTEGV